MNIRQVYFKQAQLYLNSSLVTVLLGSIFIFLNVFIFSEKRLMVLSFPFLLYSLLLFQFYLLQYKRSISLSDKVIRSPRSSLLFNQQIILFYEKEAKTLLFFNSSGALTGKLFAKQGSLTSRMDYYCPKEFILEDYNQNKLASYFYQDETVDVYLPEHGYIGGAVLNKDTLFHNLSGDDKGEAIKAKLFLDEQVKNSFGQIIFRIRKGWMPIRCQKVFHTPNLPIVFINPTITNEEKLLYFSLLIKRLAKK
ncbi:hypothetical protein [Pseudoneobacillus sp. C159]